MHARRQELLSERDSGIGKRLTGWPELEPPPRARTYVLAAMREAAIDRSSFWSRSGMGLAAAVGGIAVGSAALLGALLFAGYAWVDRGATATSPALLAPQRAAPHADLVQTSWRLEQLLDGLPAQRRLMRAGTASTIAALESQIAVIDGRLSFAAADGLEPEFEQALWQERVDAMSALVQIRYAQSRLFTY